MNRARMNRSTMNPVLAEKMASTTFIRWLVLLVLPSLLITNQAYALSDDETAVLVGLAVGGVAALSVKHHLDHDRRHQYTSRYYNHQRHGHDACDRRHHHGRHDYRKPYRSQHYVIHRPPSRHFDRSSNRYDHHARHSGRHSDRHHGERHSVRF